MFPATTPAVTPTLAIFASDKGPGDAERSSIMSQVGTHFARKGAKLVCLAENGGLAVPLITSARAAGGEVLILATEDAAIPQTLVSVPVERIADAGERLARMAALADVLVGLPGSLASASALFTSWTASAPSGQRKPAVLLNRNRAFEVMRGFSADILSHSIRDHEKALQFADSVEDLWARIARLTGAAH